MGLQILRNKADYRHFIAGGIAASLTASICCLGPLLLLATGVSGAWMSKLMLFERYQTFLVSATVLAFTLAGYNLFLPSKVTAENNCCKEKKSSWKRTALFIGSVCLALVFISSEYWIQFVA